MNGTAEQVRVASLQEVLQARDQRAARQRTLLDHFGFPVLSLTLVSPGPVKDSSGRRALMDMAETCLSDTCRAAGMTLRHRSRSDGPAGPESLWVVECSPEALKRLAIGLEDSRPWGRLIDADVIVADVRRVPVPLGRHLLGCASRRCLVCGAAAKECMGSRRHHPAAAAAMAASLIGRFTGMP